MLQQCWLVTQYRKSNSCNRMRMQHMNNEVIIIWYMLTTQFGLLLIDWYMVWWQKKCVNGEQPWERIKHANQRAANWTRKKGLKIYADKANCAIDPARLVPTICHHKLPTTVTTSLTLSNSHSPLCLKYMQVDHAHPTMSYIHLESSRGVDKFIIVGGLGCC